MREPLFEISGADVFIPGSRERELVLQDINWRVESGAHTVLLGANGSGKSSLLKLIHGDLWPCRGAICWYAATGRKETSRIVARDISALVSPAIQEEWQRRPWQETVAHFLERARTRSSGNDGLQWQEMAALFRRNGLDSLLAMELNRLSQGQLRLVLLAGALKAQPRLLLLDEYTDGLDAASRTLMYALLESLRDRMTMIFTSHHPDSLPEWCANRLYLRAGRQVPSYSPTPVQDNILPEPEPSPSSQTLFALSNVSVYIDRRKILADIDWQASQGEHWQISGGNGSGKSTFLRLLAGDEFSASDGEIRRWNPLLGKWMSGLDEMRSQIMLVSDLALADNDYPMNALEFVLSGLDNTATVFREFSEREKTRAFMLLKEFFPEMETRKLAYTDRRRLSTGQMRRLQLARASLKDPATLLLDEPMNGLDAESRLRYQACLRRFVFSGGLRPTIIMVSHREDDMPAFITRQAVFENGHMTVLK